MRWFIPRPPGGGPAPLIYNPVKKWLYFLVGIHIVLMFFSCLNFLIPTIFDVNCVLLLDNITYAGLIAVVAFFMAWYYSLLSGRRWGTEKEWAIVSIVTFTMAIVNLGTNAWGTYILVTSSQSIYGQETIPDSCLELKAIMFYYCSAIVIATHMVVAISCGIFALLLTKRLSEKLDDLRDLV
ncbi:putative membrane protein [Cardiosporidium cionae]|uniref:Membrane protein n=1 Tax=Cardiosporidium cionae TaxID=476202 RepID=A0ABQ7J518_9APIC|nr:putative membrane protein [Cardiosporidium cionae]|eukprot:KAF8819014.1 putative membrane protein [Cardiosporidium cionae]